MIVDAQLTQDFLRYTKISFSAEAVIVGLVNERGEVKGIDSINVDDKVFDGYGAVSADDPLTPHMLVERKTHYDYLSNPNGRHSARRQRYHDYTRSIGYEDEIHFIITEGSEPVAFAALYGTHRFDVAPEKMMAFHRFAEHGLRLDPRIRRRARSIRLRRQYSLTEREIDVVELVADGASNRAISSMLGISLPTTKTHVARTLDKLGAHNRAEMIAKIARF